MSPTIQQAKHMFGRIISKSNVNYYFPHFLTARPPCGPIPTYLYSQSSFLLFQILIPSVRGFLRFNQMKKTNFQKMT